MGQPPYDVTDRMLAKPLLQYIETLTGRKFTMDACCNPDGSNALCEKFCHKDNSFTSFDCRGEHIWLNPPFKGKLVREMLANYHRWKRLAPRTTSCCLLLPVFIARDLHPNLKRWRKIHTFPKFTTVVQVPYPDGTYRYLQPGLPFDMVVLYDPPEEHLVSFGITSSTQTPEQCHNGRVLQRQQSEADVLKLVARGRLAHSIGGYSQGPEILIGFDTMASRNFISRSLLQIIKVKAKLPFGSIQSSIVLGDGQATTRSHGVATVHVSIQGYKDHLVCEVMDTLPGNFGLIIGQPWFVRYRCLINYSNLTCKFYRKRHKYVIQCGNQPDAAITQTNVANQPIAMDTTQLQLLSALQCKRIFRKPKMLDQDRTFWLLIQQVQEPMILSDTMDPTLEKLLKKHSKIFEEPPPGIPTHGEDEVEHPIDLTPDGKPPFRAIYRLSKKEKDECQKTIDELLTKGYIEPSKSPYGAPILFVSKKDGTLRMCVDYRALNKLTVKNRFPLPRIDDLLESLSGASYFTAIDLASGYHQIPIRSSDVPKTAFRTPMGHFQWKVMPFGLCNAPATFQHAMNNVFGNRIGKYVLVYMDDILIYSPSKEDHIKHLDDVLGLLAEHNYYVKKKKCEFFKTEVKFLGHVVGKEGLRVDPDKINVVKTWARPKDKSEIRSLLGFGNYFRRFIFHYSELVRPLTDLTKANTSTEWTSACEKAFQDLKSAIVNAPVLKHPDCDKPFKLICDASNFASGSILVQDGHPCAFASKKFNKAERNYTTEERELLAVIHGLKLFRCYLEGVHFTIVTDHNPLKYFDSKTDLSPRQARWAHYLARFDYEWEWIKGTTNPADFLSRNPVFAALTRAQSPPEDNPSSSNTSVSSFTSSLELPKPRRRSRRQPAKQLTPETEERLLFKDNPVPTSYKTGKKMFTRKKNPRKSQRKKKYSLRHELPPPPPEWYAPSPETVSQDQYIPDADQRFDIDLIKIGYSKDRWFTSPASKGSTILNPEKYGLQFRQELWFKGNTLVLPRYLHLRKWALQEFHDSKYAGHFGTHKTLQNLKRVYWWHGMNEDVKNFVRSCHSCQRSKPDQKKPAGLLKPLPIPNRPWESISMDLITSLPLSPCGHDAICTVVDRLTKMVHFFPCPAKCSAIQLASLFVDNIFKLHGIPNDIISDRDPRFLSSFWREVCRLLGTQQNLSTPYHPQSDGQTERMNRVLEEMLRHFVAPHHSDWIKHLATCEFAINNSVSESTGYTPFYLTYGYNPLTPGNALQPSTVPAAKNLHRQMLHDLEDAKLHLQAAQQRQKYYYDTTRRVIEYAPGDLVLLSTRDIGLYCAGTPKLLPRYIGPFKVLERVGELAYRLEIPETLKIHDVFHVSRLKTFYDDGRVQPPPLPLEIDGELNYEVEKVYSHRDVKVGKTFRREYLVRWKGCGVEHDEYLPLANFGDCLEPVREYWRFHVPVSKKGSVDPTEVPEPEVIKDLETLHISPEVAHSEHTERQSEELPVLLDTFDSESDDEITDDHPNVQDEG